jgi:NhaP-type Na+/H+ or K+/H+ antiporter
MISAALFAFAVACMVVCAWLRTRRAAALFSVAVFLVLALGVPFGEVAWKCLQAPTSEACVWGKSLLLISVAFGVVIGAVIGGGAWFLALGFQRRRRNASGATDSSHQLDAGE